MSDPILPKVEWPEGIAAARVPANINSLRDEALERPCLGVANNESTPAAGDVWIVGDTPTGAFASFSENDIALFQYGSWYAWAPVAGVRLIVNGVRKVFNGTAWVDDASDGIPDAPSDGTTYGRKDGAWAAVEAGDGDFNGPTSSTDNALVRFDGAGGKTGQNSGVIVTDNNEISGYRGHLNQQTGTTYTLQASDAGKIVELANGSAIALTAANSLPVGFCCTIVQGGAGQVTVASSGSGSVVNRQSQFKTAGQNAMCSIYVRSNSGTNAVFVFGGDTAA